MKAKTKRDYTRLCEKRKQLKRRGKKQKKQGITFTLPSGGTGHPGKVFKTIWPREIG